jgi:ankyrin repeat protein
MKNRGTRSMRGGMTRSAECVRCVFCHLVILAMVPLLMLWPARNPLPPAVFLAAEKGDLAAIDEALRRGEDVDSRDRVGATALMAAARGGRLDAVRKLLAAGAQIEACDDIWGRPLMVAVVHGQHEVMRELIKRGADVDAVSPTGQTALWYGRMGSDEKAVRILIAGGASAEGRSAPWPARVISRRAAKS